MGQDGGRQKMRHDRVGFARAAIDNLVPWVRERGTRHNEHGKPEYLELALGGLSFFYTPAMPNLSTVARPRQVLDIYPIGARKVFSVEWEPLSIISFRPGPWIEEATALWSPRLLH